MDCRHPESPSRKACSITRGKPLLFILLLVAGHERALAQVVEYTQAFRTTAQGISAGRFLLYPSVTIDSGYNDNLFYQSENVPGAELITTGELFVTPRIMVDLPLSRSRARFAYAAQYRDYSTDQYEQTSHFSHFFDLDAFVRLGEVLTLALRDHYVRGIQEVQQFDPGGELRFGLVPFSLSEPSAEVSLAFGGRHQISLLPRSSNLNFDEEFQTGFYDYERRGLTGRYSYQLDRTTVAYGSYFREKTDQNRETTYFGDINVDTHYLGAGLQRSFGGTIVSGIAAGYETQDYEGGFGENFAGLVCDVNLAWTASDVYRFELNASRHAYQSFFVNSDYYLSNSLRLRVWQQMGRSAYWLVGLGLQRNPYADPVDIRVTPATPADADLDENGFIDVYEPLLPSQGTLRKDRAFILEAGVGIRLSPVLRLSLGYNHEARDSNIVQSSESGSLFEPFDYSVDRVFLRIEAGIL